MTADDVAAILEGRVPGEDDEYGDLNLLKYANETELEFYLYRIPTNPDGTPRKIRTLPLVDHWIGSFDLDKIAEKFGGGEFKVIAKKRDGDFHSNRRFSIEGPPIYRGGSSAAAGTGVNGSDGDPEQVLIKTLTNQYRIEMLQSALERLKAPRSAAPPASAPAAAADPFAMLERAFNLVRSAAPPGAAGEARAVLDFSLGLADRLSDRMREGGSESTMTDVIRDALKTTVPQVIEFLGGLRGRPITPSAPTVIAGAPSPAQPNAAQAKIDPFVILAELVSSAYNKGTPAADLVDAADDVLSDTAIGFLRATPDDQLLARIDQATDLMREGPSPPMTAEDNAAARAARDYFRAFLAELRKPEPGEAAEPPAAPAT